MVPCCPKRILNSIKQWGLGILDRTSLTMSYVSSVHYFASKGMNYSLVAKTNPQNWFCWTNLFDHSGAYSKVFFILRGSWPWRYNNRIIVLFFYFINCYLVISYYI